MKQVNKLRANLIYSEFKSGDCSISAIDIIQRYLKDFPSITVTGACKRKGCASRKSDVNFPIIELDEIQFDAKIENLEKAVMANFPPGNTCNKCRRSISTFERICGHHLFIQVVHYTKKLLQIDLMYRKCHKLNENADI